MIAVNNLQRFALLFYLGVCSVALGGAFDLPGDLIRSGDYASANSELGKLLEKTPDNVTLLRLKGVCLMEMGERDAAVAVLEKAEVIASGNVAVQYYLGEAYLGTGNIKHSKVAWGRVGDLAPDSIYAMKVGDVLPMLDRISTSPLESRPYSLFFRIAAEYDDNIPARSDNSTDSSARESWRMLYSLYGEYRLMEDAEDDGLFSLGVGYSLYQSYHDQSDLRRFDISSQVGTLFASKKLSEGKHPVLLRVVGDYSDVRQDDQSYQQRRGVEGQLEIRGTDRWRIAPRYAWHKNKFDDDSPTPTLFSRDGDEHDIGLGQKLYLFDYSLMLGLNYSYRVTDTDGSEFDEDSHNTSVTMLLNLPATYRFSGSVAYQTSDYADFTDTPQRVDDLWTFYGSLSRPLGERLRAELSVTYRESQSTQNFADYERIVYGFGISFQL